MLTTIRTHKLLLSLFLAVALFNLSSASPAPTTSPSSVPGSICGDGICLPPSENCQFCAYDCGSCESQGVMTACGDDHDVATLTFDDGPGGNVTLEILDVLSKYNISATFFVVGQNLADPANVATLKRAAAEGHLIASHTFSHLDLTTLTQDEAVYELVRTSDAIHQAIGYIPSYMRPPYGSISANVASLLKKLSMTPVLWNSDSNDWARIDSPAGIVKDVKVEYSSATGGVINLMHDIYETSAEQLSNIIKFYRQNNVTFVRLDECTNAPVIQPTNTGPMVVPFPTVIPTPTPPPLPITGTAVPVDALGRYCNSETTFVYKYSANLAPKGIACPKDTVCLCAFTGGESPCGVAGAEAILCPNQVFDAATHTVKNCTVTPDDTQSGNLKPSASPADSIFATFGLLAVSTVSLMAAAFAIN
eukprot:GILJ01012678.1.p1 GENE.GILJ01012678.1~~GILJ01012678.1.p1  ORF type:complete len:420 (+),score=45.20 GILJ01012678.1:311-1570(+)